MTKRKGKEPLYRRIAKDAWGVALEHKHLWLFGFFATFIGYGGVSEVFMRAYDRSTDFFLSSGMKASPLSLVPGISTIRAIIEFSAFPILSLMIFTVITALILAVFVWVVTISIGALTTSMRKIERGGDPTFSEAMKAGMERFPSLFGVLALMVIAISAARFFTDTNMFPLLYEGTIIAGIVYFISFVLFTAIAVIASLMGIFAVNYVMIKGNRLNEAVVNAWKMLSSHWLVSLEMVTVLFIVTLVIGLLAAIAALIVSVPVIFLVLLASVVGSKAAVVTLLTLAAITVLLYVLVLGSFLTTYQVMAWTMLWIEMEKDLHTSHLQRWGDRLFGWFKKSRR